MISPKVSINRRILWQERDDNLPSSFNNQDQHEKSWRVVVIPYEEMLHRISLHIEDSTTPTFIASYPLLQTLSRQDDRYTHFHSATMLSMRCESKRTGRTDITTTRCAQYINSRKVCCSFHFQQSLNVFLLENFTAIDHSYSNKTYFLHFTTRYVVYC